MPRWRRIKAGWLLLLSAALLLSACQPQMASFSSGAPEVVAPAEVAPNPEISTPTPYPTRPMYAPGELVDYIAQAGDTLPSLSARFNTPVDEILEANPFIPKSATTMPPGMPMKIPIYYLPLWGSPYQIIPDSLFVNGPAMVSFDTRAFVAEHPGWLNGYVEYASGANRSAAEIIDLVSLRFSLSPTLFLALVEYHAGGLTQPAPGELERTYPLGYHGAERRGLYRQLLWAANKLNNGYYGWRTTNLLSIEYKDGREERFDPWQNAASVALHYYFNQIMQSDGYLRAIGPDGFAKTYQALFGDPWAQDQPHIPGSLEQPAFTLPFLPGGSWAYTGGPHTGWGSGEPFAALDFAPPSTSSGCVRTDHWATAVAPGVVVRSETGEVVLDLDGDGDERTGWAIFYLHVATDGRAPLGAQLQTGDPVGHPSCEGGNSTGTHVHVARKYNGEWMPAEGTLAFNMEGWVPHNGSLPYLGTLTRGSQVVTACVCSNAASFIAANSH